MKISERRCHKCDGPIPESRHKNTRYCTEECRKRGLQDAKNKWNNRRRAERYNWWQCLDCGKDLTDDECAEQLARCEACRGRRAKVARDKRAAGAWADSPDTHQFKLDL